MWASNVQELLNITPKYLMDNQETTNQETTNQETTNQETRIRA